MGTLEGRTLEAAAVDNATKVIVGCDPGKKYQRDPEGLPSWVRFYSEGWEHALCKIGQPIGLAFYDADHSAAATQAFMVGVRECCADEAVLVLDDWDRATIREGAYRAVANDGRWQLLNEMPEYSDGLTAPAQWFGWFYGVSVWGWKR